MDEDTPGAEIGPNARIGANVLIGNNVVIGRGVEIGDDCRIGPNCVITHAILGKRVVMGPNNSIGNQGFSFVPSLEGLLRVPQLGRVLIEDDVEFGSNCTVDRGAIGDTHIERGVRFVQLFHEAWDQHGGLTKAIKQNALDTDQASAALVADLKERGLGARMIMKTWKIRQQDKETIARIIADVRKALMVDAGDRVEFVQIAPDRFEFVAATRSVTELKGMFGKSRKRVSIEDMNQAIAKRGAHAK